MLCGISRNFQVPLAKPHGDDASAPPSSRLDNFPGLLDVLEAVLAEGFPEYGRCVPHLPWYAGLRASAPSAHNCAGVRHRGVPAAGEHVL